MTEPRGRTARWNSALLLVPGSAALFGAAVWWAAGTVPTATGSSHPATSAATAAAFQAKQSGAVEQERYRAALARTIAADRANARHLRRQLHRLHAETHRARVEERAAKAAASAANAGGGAGVGVPQPVYVNPVGGQPVAPPAPPPPPPPPAVAPPPPPPVQAGTGASGG